MGGRGEPRNLANGAAEFGKICRGKLWALHISFRLVPKTVTLNDLEWRNGPYFALFFTEFDSFWGTLRKSG